MKDSEFIDLLNLYVDHELSAADAGRLEAEVQTNPARRSIYQQYCRMQKACKMLAADFQTDAEADAATAEQKVVAFNPGTITTTQRRRMGGLYTIGSFAAVAACVAIIFAGRTRPEPDSRLAPAPAVAQAVPAAESVVQPTPSFPAGATAAPGKLVAVSRQPSAHVFDHSPLLFTGNAAEPSFVVDGQAENKPLEWISTVKFSPLQQRAVPAGDLRFASTLTSEGRPLGGRAMPAGKQQPGDEMMMFQFVK